MSPIPPVPWRPVATLLLCALPAAGWASSTASSASVDSVSASVSSLSDSVQSSSRSSAGDRPVAEGEYRVVEVAEVRQTPGGPRVRVTLAAPDDEAGDSAWHLWLPAALPAARELQAGEAIAVRHRPYGMEFARGQPRRAFFLALAEPWVRELQTRVVPL